MATYCDDSMKSAVSMQVLIQGLVRSPDREGALAGLRSAADGNASIHGHAAETPRIAFLCTGAGPQCGERIGGH